VRARACDTAYGSKIDCVRRFELVLFVLCVERRAGLAAARVRVVELAALALALMIVFVELAALALALMTVSAEDSV